jgi:F-type H+-transporting ATPase subunit b
MNEILNILGSVGFNWHVALANFFNFLIILFLLNKFFFKKIGNTIENRHQIIERGLNQARDAEKALASAEEQKNLILKDANLERDAIIARASSDAEVSTLKIQNAAKLEIDSKLNKLREEEKGLEASILKSFSEKAPHLVAKLYAKTLMKEMTREDNDALIASMKA